MSNSTDIISLPVFSQAKSEKNTVLTERLKSLTDFHYKQCRLYANMLDALDFNPSDVHDYYDIPYIPVSLFKEFELLSVDPSEVFKTMTSSGTTGQAVSKIFLDRTTAVNQQKVLVKIVSDFIGSSRLPMLIIDSPSVIKDRAMFSARGAGILGFSIFGADSTYALDDDMNLNVQVVEAFLEKHRNKNILLFGFTFMIWQHLHNELVKTGRKLDLSKGIMIHGGGWKKLVSEAVSPEEFKSSLGELTGLTAIHDYYGMVEQTGSIFMECEYNHLHASIYSDIITRRHFDLSPCEFGEEGIVQTISLIPESYPGHSILTEDIGVILGEDDCPCGRKGKYFRINGRIENAEIRGCSDTYAIEFR